MAAIANAIDFFMGECLSSKKHNGTSCVLSSSHAGVKPMLILTYAVGFVFIVIMHDFSTVPNLPEFSFVYFLASALQLLGFLFLGLRMKGTKSASGISSQSLLMFTYSLLARVVVTSVYEGYLPADNTGDFWLQAVDACSLAVVVYLLFLVHKPYVHTYQAEHDTFPIMPLLGFCLVLACVLHADLNRCFIFDSMWAFSVNVEVFQMLPQLFMLAKVGGLVDSVTVHYVVLILLAAICRLSFWIWAVSGSSELSSSEGFSFDMEIGGYYVLGAYILEICIYLDFAYYCVKSWMQGDKNVSLPRMEDLESA
jgi:hypothetical protein